MIGTLPPEDRARLEQEAREEAEAIYVYAHMEQWREYDRAIHISDMNQRRVAYAAAALTYKLREWQHAQQRESLVKAVTNYLAELDNPSPDYIMRKQYRQQMRDALTPTPNPTDHGTSEGH